MSGGLLAAVVGIALLDSLNPTLFAAQFYLLTTPRPVPRIVAYICGVVAANFSGGVLALTGFRTVVQRWLAAVPAEAFQWGALALGLALLAFGLWYRARPTGEVSGRRPRSLRPVHAFVLGAAVMVNELTTALPYFVAIDRIAAAGLGVLGNLLSLGLYNAVFALPLVAFLAAMVVYGQRFTAQVAAIDRALRTWVPRLLKWSAIGFGAGLASWAASALAA